MSCKSCISLSTKRDFLELGDCGAFRLDETFNLDQAAPGGSVVFHNVKWKVDATPCPVLVDTSDFLQTKRFAETWLLDNNGAPKWDCCNGENKTEVVSE